MNKKHSEIADTFTSVTFDKRLQISIRFEPVSSHLEKTASKSVHPFVWNFVDKKTVDTQTHTHTHTQTNCSENITPPRFRGGVKNEINMVQKS